MKRRDRLDGIAGLCKTAGQMPDADALDALRMLPLLRWHLDQLERELVAEARRGKATWPAIGQALEVSRQAAWERFNREPAARPIVALDPVWHTPL